MRSIPSSAAVRGKATGRLLCFGLFDGYETPELSALLPSPDGAYVGPLAAADYASRL